MSCLAKTLALVLPPVIAAGATTAPISPFALLVCTLAVQSVTPGTSLQLQQTRTITMTKALIVQTKTCLPLDCNPYMDSLESVDPYESIGKRQMGGHSIMCGDEESSCSEYVHSVRFSIDTQHAVKGMTDKLKELCCPPETSCQQDRQARGHLYCCPFGAECKYAMKECLNCTFECPGTLGG